MPTKIDLGLSFRDWLLPFVYMVRYFWWMFIPVGVELAFKIVSNAYRRSQDAKAGLPEIDKMTGERFEEWLANFFRGRGYNVKLTPRTGDYGVDLFMTKNGRSTVVQAKRWKGSVGVKAVQEAFSGKAHYKAGAALVVTNSHYTHEARQLAQSISVELWDRERLKKEILADRSRQASKAVPNAAAGAPARRR